MSRRCHLVLFAREPRLGRVKKRLAAGLGRWPALAFYRRNLRRLILQLGPAAPWTPWLAVTPDAAARAPGRLALPGLARWCCVPQGPGDLGDRLQRVMDGLPPGPAVVVGSDIPGLGRRHVAAAFRALKDSDAVIGPSADGGYWLIGLARTRPVRAFETVAWSSETARADTEANLVRAGLSVAHLETLQDVDEAADLARSGPVPAAFGVR